MKTNNIKQLLDKYFEGQTSLQEERCLRNYFRQDNVDKSLTEFKPMFDFLNEERKIAMIEVNETIISKQINRPKIKKIRFSRICIGTAATVMLCLGVKFTFFNQQKETSVQSIVYVDGKKFTDLKTIRLQTLNTLEVISESEDDVIATQIDILNSFNDF
ncbi:MAG: hypothetical protein LBJ72_10475 [Dysgonamonadaceae bacterium]|jgi:hypothetical protein|nr:hypothetical protein [Dysgonamonadaceae bacterium]